MPMEPTQLISPDNNFSFLSKVELAVSNKMSPLDRLVLDLEREFKIKQPEGYFGNSDSILQLLTEYVSKNSDWKEYVFYCPFKYTRNLIAKNDQFELMVICWRNGQPSPIHNHEDQRCWMGCVSGQLQETYFVYKNTMQSSGSGELTRSEQHPIETGTVGYITDEIALHMIESVEPESVSLHLYSKPITECNIYCPLTGDIQRRKLGYFTQYKQKIQCQQLLQQQQQQQQPNSNHSTPSSSPQIPTIGDCSD